MRKVWLWLPGLLIAALTANAHASPLDLFGFGGKSPGMVGTGVATANDYDALYLNPAGLALVTRRRLALGAVLFMNASLKRAWCRVIQQNTDGKFLSMQ